MWETCVCCVRFDRLDSTARDDTVGCVAAAATAAAVLNQTAALDITFPATKLKSIATAKKLATQQGVCQRGL